MTEQQRDIRGLPRNCLKCGKHFQPTGRYQRCCSYCIKNARWTNLKQKWKKKN